MKTGQQTRALFTVRTNMHCQLITFVIFWASVGLFAIMPTTKGVISSPNVVRG